MPDAEHEQTAPDAPTLLIRKLTCSLVGKTQTVRIKRGSLAYRAYGQEEVTEQFRCNYGLNPQFRDRVEKGPLKIAGVDLEGEARIAELTDHPFYIATLFLPQISSRPERPHPLIVKYVKAARAFQSSRKQEIKI